MQLCELCQIETCHIVLSISPLSPCPHVSYVSSSRECCCRTPFQFDGRSLTKKQNKLRDEILGVLITIPNSEIDHRQPGRRFKYRYDSKRKYELSKCIYEIVGYYVTLRYVTLYYITLLRQIEKEKKYKTMLDTKFCCGI